MTEMELVASPGGFVSVNQEETADTEVIMGSRDAQLQAQQHVVCECSCNNPCCFCLADPKKCACVLPSVKSYNERRTAIIMHPESFRFCGYVGFWVMALSAILLTHALVAPTFPGASNPPKYPPGPDAFEHDTNLHNVFGYNNICVYWDYSPTRELTSYLYPFVELPLVVYIVINYLRFRAANLGSAAGEKMSDGSLTVQLILGLISFAGIYYFRQIFSVPVTSSVPAHTMAFYGLMVALVVVALQNHKYYELMGSMPTQRACTSTLYVWVLGIVTAAKIILGIILLSANSGGVTNINVGGTVWGTIMQVLDAIWMALAAFIPMIFSLWSMYSTPPLVVVY